MDKSNNLSESVIFPKGETAPEAFAKYFIGTEKPNDSKGYWSFGFSYYSMVCTHKDTLFVEGVTYCRV